MDIIISGNEGILTLMKNFPDTKEMDNFSEEQFFNAISATLKEVESKDEV